MINRLTTTDRPHLGATCRKVVCGLDIGADGAAISKGGRIVACFPVAEFGGMLEAHRAASEYSYEFGGDIVGYRKIWRCHWEQ